MKRFFIPVADSRDSRARIRSQMGEMEHILRGLDISPRPWMLSKPAYAPAYATVYGFLVEAERIIALPAIELRGSEEWR